MDFAPGFSVPGSVDDLRILEDGDVELRGFLGLIVKPQTGCNRLRDAHSVLSMNDVADLRRARRAAKQRPCPEAQSAGDQADPGSLQDEPRVAGQPRRF